MIPIPGQANAEGGALMRNLLIILILPRTGRDLLTKP